MDKFEAEPGTFSANNGPTPHGGVKTVAYFYDKDGNPCEEGNAAKIQILEFDASDVCIFSLIAED